MTLQSNFQQHPVFFPSSKLLYRLHHITNVVSFLIGLSVEVCWGNIFDTLASTVKSLARHVLFTVAANVSQVFLPYLWLSLQPTGVLSCLCLTSRKLFLNEPHFTILTNILLFFRFQVLFGGSTRRVQAKLRRIMLQPLVWNAESRTKIWPD